MVLFAWAALCGAATVVEYVNTEDFPNAPGGHFFYSSDPPEQAALDAGTAGRFKRTGLVFYTGGPTPLCRFYGSVTPGPNSHFFTADAAECAALKAQQQTPTPTNVKQWNYEGLGFTVLSKLQNGTCPEGAIPVHRAYNDGFRRGLDSNHRFSTSRDAFDPMIANSDWVYEGIVFCTQLPPNQAPLISEALACGALASAGGLASGNLATPLKQYTIDLARFPDAQCNDGSAATMYFRPFVGNGNRNKWVIQLQGGGSCDNPNECAQRWCSIDTNYGQTQMSSIFSPPRTIDGDGILARASDKPVGGANPFDGYNQVYLHYCSSDTWTGTARDSQFIAEHPVSGTPLPMRAHFLGNKIIDGALGTLRRDGVPALTYGPAAQAITLPDLDDADEVVLAGSSAGGMGVVNNVDRVGEMLRATNTHCTGQSCPLVYRGMMDSAWLISTLDLDWSTSLPCADNGICDAETYLKNKKAGGDGILWKAQRDQSCKDLLTPLGTDWKCHDNTYEINNHITTPFFVRMGLVDENISVQQIDQGFSLPGQGPLTLQSWGMKVRADLLALGSLKTTAFEKNSITVAPGAFGPLCTKHEAISNNPAVFETSIRVGNIEWKMFDVWSKWVAGQTPTSVLSSTLNDATCEE